MALKKINFSVDINAPKEKVWKTLWEDETYKKWTSAFSEGSHAVSDWKEGSRILFLDPQGSGMYSEIAKSIPNEFMSFRHLGIVKDGKEQPMDAETEGWSGATENYTLTEKNGVTRVDVSMDTVESHEDSFKDSFPKAFKILKELSEKK